MPTDIDIDQLDALIAEGVTLIEVLPAAEYAEEHLPGAINLELKNLDARTTQAVRPGEPVVVYCWDSL